ncbi:MAG: glycosyltransferase family A protein, partial [Nanoarchaeota archaeon]
PIQIIERTGELCDIRNELLEKSKGDWIWIVDGDEVWPDEELEKLKLLFGQYPNIKAFGFTFKQMMPFGEAEHKSKTIRLVKNTENLRWEGLFPLEILVDDFGKITTTNNPRQDIKFIPNIKFIHYSGIKKNQWREKQPDKYSRIKQS